jgi:DNA-binding response OmpR family regulator
MSTSEDEQRTGRRRRARVVLVVEDDSDCRDEVRVVLQNAGFGVLEAEDGEEALGLLLSGQTPEPTVIVLDMWLPRMTGQELLRVLRNYHRLARIPVIVTSASHSFADYAVVRAAGWLPKPFDAETLLREVRKRCSKEPSPAPGSLQTG